MDAAVLWQDFTGKHSCQMSKMEDCLVIPESECQESKILLGVPISFNMPTLD